MDARHSSMMLLLSDAPGGAAQRRGWELTERHAIFSSKAAQMGEAATGCDLRGGNGPVGLLQFGARRAQPHVTKVRDRRDAEEALELLQQRALRIRIRWPAPPVSPSPPYSPAGRRARV